jgi:hypothetical protein
MKREELKKTLRPLIKECIKEVIFEEGILSGIISEVMKGTSGQRIVETQQPVYQKPQVDHENQQRKLQEQRKRMLDAIGKDAYNGVDLFEGTTPTSAPSAPSHGPLSGTDAKDSGVDLSALGVNTSIWSKLAKGK